MAKNKNKLTDRETKMLVAIALLAAAACGFMVWAINLYDSNAKFNLILEKACDYSANTRLCKTGIDALKGMDIKDIKKL